MKNTNTPFRGLAFLTLVALITQIFVPIIPAGFALNNTYYVSFGAGNDTNDGLSPETAWQTIDKVNNSVFSEGDNILFNCGDTWNEKLVLQYSGIDGSPIFYGSYGTCDDTNRPIIEGDGTDTISESGSVSYVTLNNLSSSGGRILLDGLAVAATGITIENSILSNPSGVCIEQSGEKVLTVSAVTLNSCETGVSVGFSGTVSIADSIFSNIGSGSAIVSSPNPDSSSLQIERNTFSNIRGNAITFSSNTNILQNTFSNICSDGTDCAAIMSSSGSASAVTFSENTIMSVGTGMLSSGSQDAVRIIWPASTISITGNTFSNSERSIVITNSDNVSVTGNTFFNPRKNAILVEETLPGTTSSNTISNNTLLTYNPDYSMIRIDDKVNAIGVLASLSDNVYINTYKGKLPIIESFAFGGNSYSLDKDSLATLETNPTNFTYFGYKNYTSTGSYSGANLITNSTFSSNISGWTGVNTTLSHDSTGATLRSLQDSSQTGAIRSNSMSIVSGATYEISGIVRNITNTGGSHIRAYLQKDSSPNTLYADRVIDIVSKTTSGSFLAYVTANTTASDAELSFVVSNPNTSIELDTIVVRRVTGLTVNPRTNEARLIVNTGSTSDDFACPGGGGCPIQYRTITDTAVTFPTTIAAYSSQIILWRDPNSNFTPTNIVYKPTGSLVPSAGSVPNNQTIDLTWSSTSSNITLLTGSLLSGATTVPFNYSVASSGTLTITPPPDGTNTYVLNLENDIGHTVYTADVVTSNTPPVTVDAFLTGSEDSLSITGIVTATDINSGGTLSYSLFDPPALSQGNISSFDSDGSVDFMPTANFCGVATFTFRAFDFFGLGSDGLNPGTGYVRIICTNDDPVAIDDTFTATGGNSNLLDVLTNETDIDSPYETQSFFLSGFTLPSHGSLTITGNVFDYVPDPMYVGPDSFTYIMVDQSGGLSNTGTVTLDVIPGSNLPPLVTGASYSSLIEDTPFSSSFSGRDLNPGDTLSFTLSVLPTGGVVDISGSGFTYTPNTNFNGSDSFSFVASDGTLTSSSALINLTVNGTQDVPVVTDDTIGVEMSAIVTLDIMANDNDPDSPYTPQNLTITGYTLPSHGTLSVVGTGFSYTSDTPYLGTDSFTYAISDIDGNISNTGTVILNITSTNTPPVALSGSFTTNEDTILGGSALGTDVDGTPLTYILASDVTQGILTLSSTGGFTYTPGLNFNGSDSFTFQVSDGVFTSSSETVDISILPINDNPVAGHDTATGTEDTTLILSGLLLNDTDIDLGNVVTLSSVLTQGSKGTAILSGSTDIVYIPIPDSCGMDTITYQAQDQSGALSGTGNVTINMICTNDAPIATGSSFSMTGNVFTYSGLYLTGGFVVTDIDLDVLTYTLGSSTTQGVLVFNTGGSFQYTPNLGFSGSDSFTFSASDGLVSTSTATILISVLPNTYNLAPIAYSGSFTTNEDTILGGTLSGSDTEGMALTYSVGSGTTHGILSISSTGGFTYTPTANYNGSDSFTFRVFDGVSYSPYATGTITITSVNDLPVGTTESTTVTEDSSPTLISVLSNDTDVDIGDVLSITGLTQPSTGGTVVVSGTGILFTPTANYCNASPITFTYQARDTSGGTSSTITDAITITCVNDSPTSTDDAQTVLEDSSPTLISVLSNDTDVDIGDVLSITGLTQPSTGGTVVVSGTGILFTPTANYCNASPITFTYRARDSASALSNTGTVSLSVTCVNDLPAGITDTVTITEDISSVISVLSNDTDVDGTVASITGLTQPSTGGTVSISGTGILFTPTANYCSSNPTTFTYRAVDNLGLSSSSTSVSFTITCVNDSPTSTDDAQTVLEDASPTLISVLSNDTDVDVSDTLSITGLTQPSAGGTVSVSGTGILFTPTANYCNASPITFTYRARDSASALSNTGTVSLSVTCVNDLPVTYAQTLSMTGYTSTGTVRSLTGTLTGSDIEGSTLSYVVTTPINTGTLLLASTGGFSYTPALGFVGSATFNYAVHDGTATGNTVLVSICVVSPDSSIALPSCAGISPTIVTPTIPTGPGGGGGGGGGSASTYAFNYTQVTSGNNNVSSGLLRQLLLGRQNVGLNALSRDPGVQIIMNEPFNRLYNTIARVVETSRELTEDADSSSDIDTVADIRHYGRFLYTSINKSETLSPSEKADALRAAAERLREQLDPKPNAREYKALKYVIRILSARESFLREAMDAMGDILN